MVDFKSIIFVVKYVVTYYFFMIVIALFNLIDCSLFDRHLLKERSNDTVLLMIVIYNIDALGNFGMVI